MALLSSCQNSPEKKDDSSRLELVPEPDKQLRLEYEKKLAASKLKCKFENPDQSINGIELVDAQSFTDLLGANDKIGDFEQYNYYSKQENQTLTLTQHPGDSAFEISIFNVKYSDKASYGYRQLAVADFTTGKGIKLGLNKKQVTEILGNCYAAIDSSKTYIELYYRIDSEKDPKNPLLTKYNMPVYYGSYKFHDDKLHEFEFGFEYP